MLFVPAFELGAGLPPASYILQPIVATVLVLLWTAGMLVCTVPTLHVDPAAAPTVCPWIPPWNPLQQMPPQLDRKSPRSHE